MFEDILYDAKNGIATIYHQPPAGTQRGSAAHV